MQQYNGEKVLVIPTDKITINFVGGWSKCDDEKILENFLQYGSFIDRSIAEEDVSLKQIIPYCIIRHPIDNRGIPRYFCYKRGGAGSEKRLHSKFSLGVGGHLNPVDMEEDFISMYHTGLRRELKEELGFTKISYTGQTIGFINDNSNEVGKVHLGVAHVISPLANDFNLKIENTMSDYGFESYNNIEKNIEQFETWSQILIKTKILGEF